jgi:hypothetical protein
VARRCNRRPRRAGNATIAPRAKNCGPAPDQPSTGRQAERSCRTARFHGRRADVPEDRPHAEIPPLPRASSDAWFVRPQAAAVAPGSSVPNCPGGVVVDSATSRDASAGLPDDSPSAGTHAYSQRSVLWPEIVPQDVGGEKGARLWQAPEPYLLAHLLSHRGIHVSEEPLDLGLQARTVA